MEDEGKEGLVFFFISTGDGTHDHALARQVLTPLNSVPSPKEGFCPGKMRS